MEATDRANPEQPGEDLSPEEKLLKVIQGEEEDPVDEAVGSAAPEPAPDEAAEDREPRLRLSEEIIADEEPAVAATPGNARAPAGDLIGAADRVSVSKRKPSGKTGIGAVNKCLGAVIVLLLLLSGWEIRAHGGRSDSVDGGRETPSLGADVRLELPDLEALQKQFDRKKIWVGEETKPPELPPVGPAPAPPKKDAEEKLKLIGLAAPLGPGAEAIVHDRTKDAMYIVRVGEKLPFNDRELQVEEIHRDHVVLSEGDEKYSIR